MRKIKWYLGGGAIVVACSAIIALSLGAVSTNAKTKTSLQYYKGIPLAAAIEKATAVTDMSGLAKQWVQQAWCKPLLGATSITSAGNWAKSLAAPSSTNSFELGPPPGHITGTGNAAGANVSDARAIIPGTKSSWQLSPKFCLFRMAAPVTQGSKGETPAKKVNFKDVAKAPNAAAAQAIINADFPQPLGVVSKVSAVVDLEAAYTLSPPPGATGNPQTVHFVFQTYLVAEQSNGTFKIAKVAPVQRWWSSSTVPQAPQYLTANNTHYSLPPNMSAIGG